MGVKNTKEPDLSSIFYRRRISPPRNEGILTRKTDFGLSRRLISYTNIHANLSICPRSFRHGQPAVRFLSFSFRSVSFMLRPSGHVIREEKKKTKTRMETRRRRAGESRVMSMNFYIEMLSRATARYR